MRYKTSDEALPLSWKTSPLPKSKPKRPVGRPRKRPLESEDNSSAKRFCSESEISNSATERVCTDSDILNSATENVSEDITETVTVSPPESSLKDTSNHNDASVSKQPETESNADSCASSNIRGHYKHFTLKQKLEVVEFSVAWNTCCGKTFQDSKNNRVKLDKNGLYICDSG